MEKFVSLTKQTPSLPSIHGGQAPQAYATHYLTFRSLTIHRSTEDTRLNSNPVTKFDSSLLISRSKFLDDPYALMSPDLARLGGVWDCRVC